MPTSPRPQPRARAPTYHVRMLRLPHFAWILLTTTLVAQGHQPIAGRVLTAEGKPAAAASVTLAFNDDLARRLLPRQTLQTTTDASGRFRIDVTPGLTWTGWAMATTDRDTIAVSRVSEGLAPGVRCDLVLDQTARARVVTVAHAAAWHRQIGPLTLQVSPWAENLAVTELPLPANGELRLPPLPGERHHVAIVDRHGAVLHATQIAADATTVPLPPPMPVPVRVVDPDGRPVADAEILHEVKRCEVPFGTFPRPAWYRRFRHGATTDRDGMATVLVPSEKSPFQHPEIALFLLARKDGFAESMSGWDGARLENSVAGAAEAERLRFVLVKALPCRGRVVGAPPGTLVQIVAEATLQHEDMRAHWERAWTVPVAADGSFVCADVPAEARIGHVAVARPSAADQVGLPGSTVWCPEPTARELTIDRHRDRALLLFATLANGDPAAGARVLALPLLEPADAVVGWADRGSADAGGRLTLSLGSGDWLVWIGTDAEAGWFLVNEDDPGRTERARLEPLAVMRGKVLDAAGKPVAGARLGLVSCHSQGEAAKSTLDRVLDQVAFWYAEARAHRVQTDGRGEFALPFLRRPALGLVAQAWREGQATADFALIDGTAVDPIAIRPAK